jgi:hypothetical protein
MVGLPPGSGMVLGISREAKLPPKDRDLAGPTND